jgi:exodeoxyribonuclease VII small subunit
MAEKKKNMSFEEALAGLEKMAEILKKDGTTLEAAMESFEQGIEYYNYCSKLLNDAKQKIEVFERSTGLTRPVGTD